MPSTSKRFTMRKWNGDDALSWAVFDRKSPGKDPLPIIAGLSRVEAKFHMKDLMERYPS